MKLIEAIILAQHEYGIYGDWQALHSDGYCIGCGPFGSMYFAYYHNALITQSERLEAVLAELANTGSHRLYDELWKISRWEIKQGRLASHGLQSILRSKEGMNDRNTTGS